MVLCVSDSTQCADWLSLDLIKLMLCDAMLCDALRAAGWGRRCRRVPCCDAVAVRVSCRLLYLHNNQLSGSIPSTLGSLTALM
jgi:hypothetical protein